MFALHERNFIMVDKDDSQMLLITPYNSLGSGQYLDPVDGSVYLLDPRTLSLQAQETENAILQDKVTGLLNAVAEYAKKAFRSSGFGVYEKDESLIIAIVGSKSCSKNYWAGQWKSIWTFTGGFLKGTIDAFVKYSEEGNIQLSAAKRYEKEMSVEEEILPFIEASENDFQLFLNEAYQNMSQSAFKRLRRQLPITRTKMDWSKIGAYSLGSELKNLQ